MHVRLALQQTSVFGSQIETSFISKSSTTEYPYSKPKRKRRDPRHDKNIQNIRGNMAQTQKNPHSFSAKENIVLLKKAADLSNLCTAQPAAAVHYSNSCNHRIQ